MLTIIFAPTKHRKNAKIIFQKIFYAETNGALPGNQMTLHLNIIGILVFFFKKKNIEKKKR